MNLTKRLIVLYNTRYRLIISLDIMLKKLLVFIPIALSIGAMQAHAGMLPVFAISVLHQAYASDVILAEDEMLLTNRHRVPLINEVFADNILLTLAYLSGTVTDATRINWDEVRESQSHEIVLKPGEVFAYHDGVMARYADTVTATTNAHFGAADGFRSSGYLYGDGVCHLASLLNRAAQKAGLHVVAPVNHDFAAIPDISREYGTAIYFAPTQQSVSEMQNLYIENTHDKTVTFKITSDMQKVGVIVVLEK